LKARIDIVEEENEKRETHRNIIRFRERENNIRQNKTEQCATAAAAVATISFND
jgi:hypothetical protein